VATTIEKKTFGTIKKGKQGSKDEQGASSCRPRCLSLKTDLNHHDIHLCPGRCTAVSKNVPQKLPRNTDMLNRSSGVLGYMVQGMRRRACKGQLPRKQCSRRRTPVNKHGRACGSGLCLTCQHVKWGTEGAGGCTSSPQETNIQVKLHLHREDQQKEGIAELAVLCIVRLGSASLPWPPTASP
jgi:hypothetical protein